VNFRLLRKDWLSVKPTLRATMKREGEEIKRKENYTKDEELEKRHKESSLTKTLIHLMSLTKTLIHLISLLIIIYSVY
jgi:hypothetical protein